MMLQTLCKGCLQIIAAGEHLALYRLMSMQEGMRC